MKEYRVEWQQRPHVYHAKHVLFVECANEDDARALTINHLERNEGLARDAFSIHSITEVTKPLPQGRVKAA